MLVLMPTGMSVQSAARGCPLIHSTMPLNPLPKRPAVYCVWTRLFRPGATDARLNNAGRQPIDDAAGRLGVGDGVRAALAAGAAVLRVCVEAVDREALIGDAVAVIVIAVTSFISCDRSVALA